MENSRRVITKVTSILLSGFLILGAASDDILAAGPGMDLARISRLEAEDNMVTSGDNTADSGEGLSDPSLDDADHKASESENSETKQKTASPDEMDSDVPAPEGAGESPDESTARGAGEIPAESAAREVGEGPAESAAREAGGTLDESVPEVENLPDEEKSPDYSQTDTENRDDEQNSAEEDNTEGFNPDAVDPEVVDPEEAEKSTDQSSEQETGIEEPGDTAIVSASAVNDSYKEGDKLLTLGEEGTIRKYPQNPERTNGFDDYRIDVSSYQAEAYTLDKEGKEVSNIQANGEYQELQLRICIPEGENVWGL